MKSILAASFLALAIGSFSCNKEESGNPVTNFFPLTAGSTWTYRETNANVTYTFTATSRDSVFLGKTFRVLSNSLGGNVYATVVGQDYYRYGLLPTQQLTGSGVEEYFLKADAGLNGSWNQTQNVNYGGSNYPLKLTYKISAENGSRTVNNVAFSKVTTVGLILSLTANNISFNVGSGTFYYADGVGLIESSLNISAALPGQPAQNITQNTILLNYSIK